MGRGGNAGEITGWAGGCVGGDGRVAGMGQTGPPFQTDDPTPVDLEHYEVYASGEADGTAAVMTSVGPTFGFDWGAIPNIQLHAILPLGGAWHSNDPAYLPGRVGESAFGLTDLELGLKWGFIKQTKRRPQIGSFTVGERPGQERCGSGEADCAWWVFLGLLAPSF